jgi:hypothetical protein
VLSVLAAVAWLLPAQWLDTTSLDDPASRAPVAATTHAYLTAHLYDAGVSIPRSAQLARSGVGEVIPGIAAGVDTHAIARQAPEAADTSSVWSSIKPTDVNYPGTSVPRSFELTTNSGDQVWVHPNASEHLFERIAGTGSGPLADLKSQLLLYRMQQIVSGAELSEQAYETMQTIGRFELQIGAPREPDLLPALIHFGCSGT